MTTDTDLPDKLGVIAGGGHLPLLLRDACLSTCRPFFIIGLEGFARREDFTACDSAWVTLGQVGRVMDILKENECAAVVMAGEVNRPDFRSLKLDWKGAKLMPKILNAALGGDDALLSLLVKTFEQEGYAVIGADDVISDLLIPAGNLGEYSPSLEDFQDIKRAMDVISSLGALDIGQAAIVCNQLVLAVEAVEGTDAMLARCLDISTDLRGTPETKRGVLAKMPKPNQERRVDLPTIGVQTVEGAASAGLSGIAVTAGGVLVIHRDEVITTANEAGLFVTGI